MKTELVLISKIGVINLKKLKEYAFDDRYICDNKGTVYLIKETLASSYRCKPMSPFITKDGYTEYVLTDISGKKKHVQAHRIVAGLFLKDVPGKLFVNHKDGNKANNKYTNLEYVTHSENIKHTYDKLGRVPHNKK
jgi:hypothetical protein